MHMYTRYHTSVIARAAGEVVELKVIGTGKSHLAERTGLCGRHGWQLGIAKLVELTSGQLVILFTCKQEI